MKKLLGIIVLGLLWCNVGFADKVDKRILGGEMIPGAYWLCWDINDVKNKYTFAVNYISKEDLYTVSIEKNYNALNQQSTDFLFYGAEGLITLNNETLGNYWYTAHRTLDPNEVVISLNIIGEKRLRAFSEHWLSTQKIIIRFTDLDEISENSNFIPETIKKIRTDIFNYLNMTKKLALTSGKDPKKHFDKLLELNLLISNSVLKIRELYSQNQNNIWINSHIRGDFYRNHHFCRELGNNRMENFWYKKK